MKKKAATKESKQLKTYETEMNSALAAVENLELKEFKDIMNAADFLFNIKQIAENVEAGKNKVLSPLLESTKALRKMFRPVEDSYAQAEKIIKDKILDWHASEWARGTTPDNKISGLNGTVTVVERKRVVVDDADVIPREFCIPDPGKIEHALKAGIKVPGVSLAPEYSITSGKN